MDAILNASKGRMGRTRLYDFNDVDVVVIIVGVIIVGDIFVSVVIVGVVGADNV